MRINLFGIIQFEIHWKAVTVIVVGLVLISIFFMTIIVNICKKGVISHENKQE